MQKRKLTQEDLDNNPELAEQGLQVGDEIEIPDTEEETTEDEAAANDGGDRPPHKPDNP